VVILEYKEGDIKKAKCAASHVECAARQHCLSYVLLCFGSSRLDCSVSCWNLTVVRHLSRSAPVDCSVPNPPTAHHNPTAAGL
jgi:hypothetical protein